MAGGAALSADVRGRSALGLAPAVCTRPAREGSHRDQKAGYGPRHDDPYHRRYRYPRLYTVRLIDGGPPSAPPLIVSTTNDGSNGVLVTGCNHIV